MVLDLVLVYLTTMEILIRAADQSAFKTQIVIVPRHAIIINAKTHAPECVELMLNVGFKIIHLFVCVLLATKEIHREVVAGKRSVRDFPIILK